MIEVVFLSNYAIYKKGDVVELETMLASRLIGKHKVADLYVKPKAKPRAKKKK